MQIKVPGLKPLAFGDVSALLALQSRFSSRVDAARGNVSLGYLRGTPGFSRKNRIYRWAVVVFADADSRTVRISASVASLGPLGPRPLPLACAGPFAAAGARSLPTRSMGFRPSLSLRLGSAPSSSRCLTRSN